MKWIGQWSSTVLDDAVAFMLPKVKVPTFKYNKKEKVIFQTDRPGITTRDVRLQLSLSPSLALSLLSQLLLRMRQATTTTDI